MYRIDDALPPFEFVPVEPRGDSPVPEDLREKILIHTIHDGDLIPKRFVLDDHGKPRVDPEVLEQRFVEERDWGADLVASRLAAHLGLRGYARCRIARVLLDFNRFPGSTPNDGNVPPLHRHAIHHPFASVLSHEEKFDLLETHYDGISEGYEQVLFQDKILMIAVHTYDEHNRTMTRRPHLSLLSSVKGYQEESRMPQGYFDPIYPDVLGESTCSRILRDRISLTLERNGFRVSHNYPYALPAGCVEVRAQVWFFFRYLRQRFEEAHPESRDEPGFPLVWKMLLNTNRRFQEADSLNSFVHRYHKPMPAKLADLCAARDAYEKVAAFLQASDVEHAFRRSKNRPSSLGLEVRKDLVCSFDHRHRPLPLTDEQRGAADHVGNVIGYAIRTFLETDRAYL